MSCILEDRKKKRRLSLQIPSTHALHGEGKGDASQRQLIKYFHKKKQQSPPILHIGLKYYLRECS